MSSFAHPPPAPHLKLPQAYQFARCKRPLPIGIMLKQGVPLPADDLEVIDKDLGWDEIVVSGLKG